MDIRRICQLADGNLAPSRVAEELSADAPLSGPVLEAFAAWLVWMNDSWIGAIFDSKNAPAEFGEVWGRIVSGLRGKRGREIAADLEDGGLRGYLTRTASSIAIDYHRGSDRRLKHEVYQNELKSTPDDPWADRVLEQSGSTPPAYDDDDPEGRYVETVARLNKAIDGLPRLVSPQGRPKVGRTIAIARLDLLHAETEGRLPSFKEVVEILDFDSEHARLVQLRRWYRKKIRPAFGAQRGDGISTALSH